MHQDGAHTQNRRTFLKAVGGATAAVSLAGCMDGVGDTGHSGTLIYTRGAPSTTLDPQNTKNGAVAKVTNQIYDKLIQFTPGKNKLEAGLATKYELNGTKAVLELREGVKFQNGDEFTAQDFKATYRRFTDPSYRYYPGQKYVSSYGQIALGNWVKSITAETRYVLEIELKQKYAPFLRNLAMFACAVLSEKAIREKTTIREQNGKKRVETSLNEEPVGTGPFKLEQYESGGQRILLSSNEDYWDDGPKLEKLVFNAISKTSTRVQTLISGETDVIDGLDTNSSQQVKNMNSASLKTCEGMNIGYMAFNMGRFEPFRNKAVRHALSYAVNTEVIVNNIFKGIAKQASQPVPSNVLGYNEELSPYPYDPAKAKRLLKEAGYGTGLTFELATFKNPRAYNPSPVQAAQQVRSDLTKVGVEISINQMSLKPFLNYVSTGKHDACLLGWNSDNGDPDNFYYLPLHPGIKEEKIPKGQDWVSFDTEGYNTLNVSGWANRKFMAITERAQVTYEREEREKLYQQAGKIAHEEAPWVFMNHAKELRGVRETVSGYIPAAIGGPYLNLVSVDK